MSQLRVDGIIREDTEVTVLSEKEIYQLNYLPDGTQILPQKVVPIVNISSYKGNLRFVFSHSEVNCLL